MTSEASKQASCTCDPPCPTYVNGNQTNSARRPACEPAPTVLFGHRSNDVRWVVDRRTNSKAAGGGKSPSPPVSMDRPAPTITAGNPFVFRPDWAYERPATTIVGSFCPDVVAAPGYRTSVSRQNAEASVRVTVAEASVRVTVAEASVLQSFPADYPWHGSRTAQFRQVGDAVPPRLAMHVVAATLGLPIPDLDGTAA